jgi:N-acyl-D-amino-acid deacylase
MAADLALIDLNRIRDRATFFDPHQYAEGVEAVWVGGVAVVADGKPTMALPGRVLTKEGGRFQP